MTVSVLWIEPVMTTTAGLLVTMLADKTLSARLATTEPSAHVLLGMLETH